MRVPTWEHSLREKAARMACTFKVNWHLGLTAFGGPPVHFKIFHDRFVRRLQWVDDQMYQELFSISQALSGPASTKMLYCINLIQDGLLSAILAFMIWSLPGALGMYGLSLGVSNIGSSLPRAVYALLSGLNAATVGIIAHAAVELSDKSINDKLTRTLVFLSAAAGIMYNAIWFFPILMCAAGCSAIVHDYRWIQKPAMRAREMMRALLGKRQGGSFIPTRQGVDVGGEIHLPSSRRTSTPQDRNAGHTGISLAILRPSSSEHQAASTSRTEQGPIAPPMEVDARRSLAGSEPRIIPREFQLQFSWKAGAAIIATFFATFITVMAIRGIIPDPPVLYKLFSNLYLAGTIIFGGGPVVIPLLREYIVVEGWVSPRDFLIGLAIAQSFPGPNFNFAVFLGGLTAANAGYPASIGAAIAFSGIFTPGLVLVHGTMGVWGALRSRPWVKAMVRGVNASAVGLIYTAVYRIWQVGYLDEGFQSGKSLGDDPWWVVVTATAYVGGRYYKLAAPLAVLLGATMGLIRYGVVST